MNSPENFKPDGLGVVKPSALTPSFEIGKEVYIEIPDSLPTWIISRNFARDVSWLPFYWLKFNHQITQIKSLPYKGLSNIQFVLTDVSHCGFPVEFLIPVEQYLQRFQFGSKFRVCIPKELPKYALKYEDSGHSDYWINHIRELDGKIVSLNSSIYFPDRDLAGMGRYFVWVTRSDHAGMGIPVKWLIPAKSLNVVTGSMEEFSEESKPPELTINQRLPSAKTEEIKPVTTTLEILGKELATIRKERDDDKITIQEKNYQVNNLKTVLFTTIQYFEQKNEQLTTKNEQLTAETISQRSWPGLKCSQALSTFSLSLLAKGNLWLTKIKNLNSNLISFFKSEWKKTNLGDSGIQILMAEASIITIFCLLITVFPVMISDSMINQSVYEHQLKTTQDYLKDLRSVMARDSEPDKSSDNSKKKYY